MKKILNVITNTVLTNLMIFFALISIHEIGHVLIGYYLGCSYGKAILFDTTTGGTYTELFCPAQTSNILVNFSGLIITSLFAVAFLLLKSPNRYLFFIILGFSLIFSVSDISMFFSLQILFYLMLACGFSFVIIGEYSLASSLVVNIDNINSNLQRVIS